jgi:hypothetical protein
VRDEIGGATWVTRQAPPREGGAEAARKTPAGDGHLYEFLLVYADMSVDCVWYEAPEHPALDSPAKLILLRVDHDASSVKAISLAEAKDLAAACQGRRRSRPLREH